MIESIIQEIQELKALGRYRSLRQGRFLPVRRLLVNGIEAIDFASNDYLGLRNHSEIIAASRTALETHGTGAGASRLISGNYELYQELESSVARFKETEAGLVFTSGYALNVSVIPALVKQGDCVIVDKLNHASIIDGARLSGAKLMVYAHCDMNRLKEALKKAHGFKRCLVVTDTVFSMDGDIAPLKDICALCERYDALLMVDEAHATGVFGKEGRGMVNALGLTQRVPLVMGTFSKALGSMGAFLACSTVMRDYIINKARGFIFTTGLPPAVLAANIKALDLAAQADTQRLRLVAHSQQVREALQNQGKAFGKSETQIIPVIIGNEKKVVDISTRLLAAGLFVPAIRYPAVKKGSARLRIALSSDHTDEHVAHLCEELAHAR